MALPGGIRRFVGTAGVGHRGVELRRDCLSSVELGVCGGVYRVSVLIGDFCATPGIASSGLGRCNGCCARATWYGVKLASNTTARRGFWRPTLLFANKCLADLLQALLQEKFGEAF